MKQLKEPYLLYVGNAYPHKNLERLISAFKIVLQKQPELYLVLVGKIDYFYERLQDFVKELGLEKNVIFTGYVSDSELSWLYTHGLAYVFPSLSEGFGLPGLEAMTHSLPVISSNKEPLPEIYGEAALYFNPEDINEMAHAILQIVQSKEVREKLKKVGRVKVKKYSWDRCAKQTLEVYKSVLKI
ncbi:glycosyltransferase family 4 protein [Patescibacteria group bacterium AH-259-L05]|nr:glycosyltransferase family 4 protein [Patescibacteria group bacterium AH-259-L05]